MVSTPTLFNKSIEPADADHAEGVADLLGSLLVVGNELKEDFSHKSKNEIVAFP